jgi:hypothetical protein
VRKEHEYTLHLLEKKVRMKQHNRFILGKEGARHLSDVFHFLLGFL